MQLALLDVAVAVVCVAVLVVVEVEEEVLAKKFKQHECLYSPFALV